MPFAPSTSHTPHHCRSHRRYVFQNSIVDAPEEELLLFQTRYLDMFRVIATEAARRGILIMIACHRCVRRTEPIL